MLLTWTLWLEILQLILTPSESYPQKQRPHSLENVPGTSFAPDAPLRPLQTQCHLAMCTNVTFHTKLTLVLISTQSSELLKNSRKVREVRCFLQSNIAFTF